MNGKCRIYFVSQGSYFIYFHFTVSLFLYLQSWVYYPKEQVITILMCALFSISVLRFPKCNA